MAVVLRWSPMAKEDLRRLYRHIAADQPLAAERVLRRIEARCLRLVGHPRLGGRRPDIGDTTRVVVEAPFLVLYETCPDTDDGPVEAVVIVRVVDGRRDLESL